MRCDLRYGLRNDLTYDLTYDLKTICQPCLKTIVWLILGSQHFVPCLEKNK